jgi:predicted dehydrogenase
VGYGKGGRLFHAPHIDAAPECTVAGVVTRSPDRRAAASQDHPGVLVRDSLAELAAVGVDAVVVTTPLTTHIDLVREAIGLGLPVVCDKPFAATAELARQTVRLAEEAGVLLTVYQNRRWDADFRTTAAAVATGGGVLLDFGSHVVDQALTLFGPARSVYAERRVVPGTEDFDDRFSAVVHHTSGVSSHIAANWDLHGAPAPRFRVLGTEGTFAIPSDDGQTRHVLAGRTPRSLGAAWGQIDPANRARLFRRGVGEDVEHLPGAWSAFYSGLAQAIRGQGAAPVDPWEAVAALEVLDAARVSAATGDAVRLG